jgi:hypothetical protein
MTKGARAAKLREDLHLRPEDLREETVVGEASAAVQRAAAAAGVQLGPTKETRAGVSSREIATIAIEGQAGISSAVGFIDSLASLGAPIVVDSVHLKAAPGAPGAVSFSMTLVVLNYAAWKPPEKSGA